MRKCKRRSFSQGRDLYLTQRRSSQAMSQGGTSHHHYKKKGVSLRGRLLQRKTSLMAGLIGNSISRLAVLSKLGWGTDLTGLRGKERRESLRRTSPTQKGEGEEGGRGEICSSIERSSYHHASYIQKKPRSLLSNS